MVERQTQVATSGKWRPQRSGEESATAPWIARVEAHCTCTLHSWDLKYLKKHIRPQPWHLWQFGEGEQYHFLTGCLEVHWMYAIVFHWKYMLVCTKADGWASSFVDWPISFVQSILIKVCSCVPQFYFTSSVSSFAEVSGNLAWFACQPLKPSWNLHWSELVNVFTHTPAVSAVSKEEGWDSEAEAKKWMQCVQWSKKREKKREGTSSSWSYNSYSWPISLPHCHSFICTRSFESEPYRGEVTKINLEYRTMDGQWFLAFRKYEICPTGAWDLWTIFQTQGVFNCGTCVCILKWSWGLRTRSVPEWQQYITV